MSRAVAATVFRLIQIVLLPPGAVGYLIWVPQLVRHSRRTGTSATVLASFYTRWMQHRLGTRDDEPCARLMTVLPNVSPLGLRLVTVPTLVAHRVSGHVPRIYTYPYVGEPPMIHQAAARTTFFDAALHRHLGEVDQVVVLGAGLDTRSYRMPGPGIRCFEVDEPRTQEAKRAALAEAGVTTTDVTYVPADFEVDDWFERLVDAGFDAEKRAFFLWEAVTMYLDRTAVEATLRRIAGTADGSVVAFDYISDGLVVGRSLFMRYVRAVLRATGEPWKFGLDTTPPTPMRVAAFLGACGLAMEEQRDFGPRSGRAGAPAGFATAVTRRSRGAG